MVRKYIIAIITLLLFTTKAFAAVPATVVIHDRGVIWGKDILLGSIADIGCSDPQRLQELININLGFIAKPGDEKTVSDYVLRLKLQSSRVDLSNITWTIPESVVVKRKSQVVSAADILTAAKAKMKNELIKNNESRKWTLEETNTPADVVVPPGDLELTAELPYGLKYTVPTPVYVSINVKGETVEKVICRIQLHTFADAVVAAKFIPANHVLVSSDVTIEQKEINPTRESYLTAIDNAVGKILRHPVKIGDIIDSTALVKPDIIKRGMPVNIVGKSNGLQVKTMGVALMSGSEGEIIKVRNTRTGNIVSGRVVDDETVQIDLTD